MIRKSRLHALDTFRGLTIACMIIVNSPGNSSAYSFLEHAPWNGCTVADLVFPFFLCIVGISCSLSISRQTSTLKIIKRSLLIFAIGLLLNAFPNYFYFGQLRILGVLQRIALCYAVAAFAYSYLNQKMHYAIIAGILLGYWFILIYFSPPTLTPDDNITALFDQTLLGTSHLYRPTFDPEGLLTTLPAIATTLLGNVIGFWLQNSISAKQIGLRGLLMTLIGLAWSTNFPFNKTLWTSSYVLYTAGLACIIFAWLYWLIDIQKHQKWCVFFDVFGVNALAAYVLHVFFLKIQAIIHITQLSGETLSLRVYLTQQCFPHIHPESASLLYAISYLVLWFIVLLPLYHKKIYVKL
jgi:predicted acyltransferase